MAHGSGETLGLSRLHERISALYALALVTLYLLFLPVGGYARMMEGKYHAFLALSLAYVAAMTLTRAWGGIRRYRAETRAAVIYLALVALSAAFSPYGSAVLLGGTRRDGLLTVALYVAVYLLLARYLRPTRALLDAAVYSASASALLVLVQLAGKNPLWLYPGGLNYFDGDVAYSGFYAGTSGNIDFTAFTLALAAAAAWVAVVRGKRWRLAAPFVLLVWTLVRLEVAAALLGLAVTLIVTLPLLFPKHRRAMCVLALSLFVAALGSVALYRGENEVLTELSRALRGDWDDALGSGRIAIWRACIPLVAERPLLGGGCGTLYLRDLEPLYWYREGGTLRAAITSAHNAYLGILVDQGALALAAFLALVALSLRRLWRGASRTRCAVCIAVLVCYAVMALFSVATCITSVYLWLLLAVAAREG